MSSIPIWILCWRKITKPPVWNESANHGRIGAIDYTGWGEVILKHSSLSVGSAEQLKN
jgi:hypothetical protein